MEIITRGNWKGFTGCGLSDRELEFTLAVANGATDKEIARQVGLACDSVKKRIYNAMFKLGVNRRAALIAEAMRRGLIAPAMAMFLAVLTCSSISSTDPALRVRRGGHGSVAAARVLRRSEWVA